MKYGDSELEYLHTNKDHEVVRKTTHYTMFRRISDGLYRVITWGGLDSEWRSEDDVLDWMSRGGRDEESKK